MKPIKIYKFQHMPSFAQATTGIGTLPDGRFMVTRNLPCGMDIAPDYWRYSVENAAWNKFNACNDDLQRRGFSIVQTVG